MQRDLLAFRSDEMIDNMRSGSRPATVAEPFLRQLAADDVHRIVDPAIRARVFRKIFGHDGVDVIVHIFIVFFELDNVY
jgi:hypothetical protein